MEKVKNTTAEDVQASVSSIYSALIGKRKKDKEAKEEEKRLAKEAKEAAKQDKKDDEEEKISKRAKREKELDAWKSVFCELTGDDLEYVGTKKKKGKKKYKKWIDDDLENEVRVQKAKKVKKKNYRKEFEPELNMLKTLLAEQNRINADMLKRFQNAAGPATKDAMFPNKTLVELMATINAGKTNSLSMLREIGSLKKAVADLEMKRKKMELDAGGSNNDSMDLGLMGSSLASNMFMGSTNPYASTPVSNPVDLPVSTPNIPPVTNTFTLPTEEFDPATWEGIPGASEYNYEDIPHEIYVEQKGDTGEKRFVAVRTDTGEEINIPNLPTVDPNTLPVDEKKGTVKGKFEEVYKLKIV